MHAYTDYPLATNPDGRVVDVIVLAYDRNKYATVRHGNAEEAVKRGYLFHDAALTRRLPDILWRLLPQEVGGPRPTRLQAHREQKALRRAKETRYVVWAEDTRYDYGSLAEALRHFAHIEGDCQLNRNLRRGNHSSFGSVLSREDGQLFISCRRGRHFIKKRHLRQYGIC